MLKYIIYLVIGINILTFVLMAVDKIKAIKKSWRIKEITLLTLAFLWGSIGLLSGMIVFRHKIRKIKFVILTPLFIILHGGLIYLLIYR